MRIAPRTNAQFVLFPLVIIIGSFTEELLFRGYLFWALAPLLGVWGAATIASVAFGLAHAYQGPSGILRTGVIGLAFAIGFALTHSLWWLIVAHMILNSIGYFVAIRVKNLPSVQDA
ncbi:CPBP family intramembrane glutamic endopeptidase [Novosphingobium sp. ZN18A2]|uniref:CPBP family intramembrane glutamic endopeptidase n=1 Tax=Novosphingobium sp. ZN18A2 TaxID=3079861 RepID=UPI0030D2B4E5